MYSIANNAADEKLLVALLVKIVWPGGSVYWTDGDVPILWDGQTWAPFPVRVPSMSTRYGEVQGLDSIELGNADSAVSALVFAESCGGSRVEVSLAYFDPAGFSTIPNDVRLKIRARIGQPRLSNDGSGNIATCMISLAPLYDFKTKVNWRTLAPGCGFPFKGADGHCGSTGTATSCDKTLSVTGGCGNPNKIAGALAQGNRKRFGGTAQYVNT